MSRIDDLVQQYASDGVEYRALGDVGTFVRGNGLQKMDFVDDGFPCIHYGQIYTYYGTSTMHTKSFVSHELAERLRRAKTGDLVIATTSENMEDVGKAVAWLGEGEIAFGGHTSVYSHSLDPLYVAYFFQSESYQQQKKKHVSGTKVKELPFAGMAKIKIPVPPLEVQREVVRILTTMESLEAELAAELAAELEARRQQYAHYRDALVTFSAGAEFQWLPLGDLAGAGFFRDGDWVESKDQDPDGGVRLTQLADVGVDVFRDRSNRRMREDQADRLNCTFLEPGDLLIARIPDPLGRACEVPTNIGRAVTVVDVAILRSQRDDVLPRYVMYAINSRQIQRKILSFQAGGTRQRITRKNLGTVEIPIPPIEEQRRIVELLDRFDARVNNLSSGLPAEIQARRQQYAYYRDRLLSFEEAAA